MPKKIGTKLLLSYLILLIAAFSVSTAADSFLSRRYVANETRKELIKEGQAISKLLTNLPLTSTAIRNRLAGKTAIKAAERFVEADMLIINNKNEIIYKSIDSLDRKAVLRLAKLDGSSPKGYIAQKIKIIDKNGTIKGHVVLFTKLNDIYELNRLMRGAEFFSMLAAGLIALAISLLFEKSLVRPIALLTKKVEEYSVTKHFDSEPIKTDDEIQQLDERFIAMAKSIHQYNETQQRFLQNTSHELKTPLMSIQGYAEAIKDGVVTGQAMEEGLDIIIEQTQRLKKIVEELIYLTRLENPAEKLDLEVTNLKELVYSTTQSIKPIADEKHLNIEVEIDSEINIICDREKLNRAILNILSNGIRYAESLIAIAAVRQYDQIKLTIADDGKGFNNMEETKIFDRFYKGEKGCSGLGLSIVKAIIEAHGGNVKAYNSSKKGAVFEILLPIK